MDISRLEFELDSMIDESDIPAVDFAAGLVTLAQSGRWDLLERVFGRENTLTFKADYDSDPAAFCKRFNDVAVTCRKEFVDHAERRLTRLGRVNFGQDQPGDFAESLQ